MHIEKVQFTHKQLREIEGSLAKLMNASIPIATASRLRRFSKQVIAVITDLDKDQTDLVKKYGEKIEGDRMRVKDEHRAKWDKEMEALMAEIHEFSFIKLSLEDLDKAGLSMKDLAYLDFIIEGVEDEEATPDSPVKDLKEVKTKK